MAERAKTADRARAGGGEQSAPCPMCGKPTRVVKRMKNREMKIAGGMYLSCSVCDFSEKK